MRQWSVAVALAASLACLAAAAQPASTDAVWKAAEAARTEQLDLLRTLVNIDSGTGDVEAGRKIAGILIRAS